MKLYNKTKYPDALLERLLVEAGKAVNARTTGVIAIATSAKAGYNHCYGMAHGADFVKRFALDTRQYKKRTHELKRSLVATDGGYFTIVLPYPFVPDWIKKSDINKAWQEAHCFDGLTIAELIFSVASHEWQHIKQYQDRLFNFRDREEKKKRWHNRSWEKDSIKASSKATSNPRNVAQEAILNLALWIEAGNEKSIKL